MMAKANIRMIGVGSIFAMYRIQNPDTEMELLFVFGSIVEHLNNEL